VENVRTLAIIAAEKVMYSAAFFGLCVWCHCCWSVFSPRINNNY